MAIPPPSRPASPPTSATSTSSTTSKDKMPLSNSPATTTSSETDHLPPPSTLQAASTTPVYSAPNQSQPFHTLYTTTPPTQRTTLLIFIRHFFCGNCQEFLRRLASTIPPSSLPPSTSIAIIGCGSPTLIPSYITALDCHPLPFPYPIYADPTKTLHTLLDMRYSLSLGSKSPSYMERSLLRVNLESTVQGLKRLWGGKGDALMGGDMRLNGGDFVVVTDEMGENARVEWCHRMRNTRDHAEVEILKGVLLGLSAAGGGDGGEKMEKEADADADADRDGEKVVEEEEARPGLRRRRSTTERLRRSFSSRRKSWLERNGSVGRESKAKVGTGSSSNSRDVSQRRKSPEPVGMNVVREEVRSRDGEEKPAFAAMNGGEGRTLEVLT